LPPGIGKQLLLCVVRARLEFLSQRFGRALAAAINTSAGEF
jgi:hypothetical protein